MSDAPASCVWCWSPPFPRRADRPRSLTAGAPTWLGGRNPAATAEEKSRKQRMKEMREAKVQEIRKEHVEAQRKREMKHRPDIVRGIARRGPHVADCSLRLATPASRPAPLRRR